MRNSQSKKQTRGFLLAESCLCLFSLCTMSLYLSQTMLQGEANVKASQIKVDREITKNRQYKQEIAEREWVIQDDT